MKTRTPMSLAQPRSARRVAPGGSLTEGEPLREYPAGVYDFRMPVLVLALEPVVDAAAFPSALQLALSEVLDPLSGDVVRSAGISVGAPFAQHVDRQVLGELLPGVAVALGATGSVAGVAVMNAASSAAQWSAVMSFLGGPYGAALLIGVPAAALVGGGVGVLADEILGRNQVTARWITVAGTIELPLYPAPIEGLERAMARAVASVVRFRHPARRDELVSADGASILARLSAPDACTGGRRYDKVYAAACLRLERSQTPMSTYAPRATAAPGAPTPTTAAARVEPVLVEPSPEPPTRWEGDGPRPTIPPEQLHEPAPRPTLAERARRWAGPALVAVTAVSAAALAWSVFGTGMSPEAAAVPTETRLNGARRWSRRTRA